MVDYPALRERVVRLRALHDSYSESLVEENTKLAKVREEVDFWSKAAVLLRSISDSQTEALRESIESLVTRGLQIVFEDQDVEFKVEARQLRGQLGIEFFLVTGGVQRPVLGAHGGGVAELVAFVLRVVIVKLTGKLPILILDEPFGMVSADYRSNLSRFVREVADLTGVQLVIVTHDDHLPEVADSRFHFSLRGGDY